MVINESLAGSTYVQATAGAWPTSKSAASPTSQSSDSWVNGSLLDVDGVAAKAAALKAELGVDDLGRSKESLDPAVRNLGPTEYLCKQLFGGRMYRRIRTIAAIMGTSALLVACGDDSNSTPIGQPVGSPSSPRTVEIAMVDIGFEPAAVNVRPGETIRFAFDNEGFLPHEAIFGDGGVQEDHEVEMQAAGGSHDAMNMGDTTDVADDMDAGTDMNMDDTDVHDGDEPEAEAEADEPEPEADQGHGDAEAGDADGGHDESGGPPSVSLEPGETGEILMTFDGAWSAGTIIGCHVPGHWAAGMRIDVEIVFA
jgi:uncharacterized cupredoxin-like copper-binding protein